MPWAPRLFDDCRKPRKSLVLLVSKSCRLTTVPPLILNSAEKVSAMPLPYTSLSEATPSLVTLRPSTVPAVWTAYLTPFRVGMPSEASAPDSGRSTPILMVPLLAVPPPLVPQAASARLATARPASNFDNLIETLLPKIRLERVSSPMPEGVALYTTLPKTLQQ